MKSVPIRFDILSLNGITRQHFQPNRRGGASPAFGAVGRRSPSPRIHSTAANPSSNQEAGLNSERFADVLNNSSEGRLDLSSQVGI